MTVRVALGVSVLAGATLVASAHIAIAEPALPNGKLFGRADFNGDGRVDQASVRRVREHGALRIYLRVTLANGRTISASIRALRPVVSRMGDPSGCFRWCGIYGTGDLDRDGRAEVAITAHSASSGFAYVVYHLTHGQLRPLIAPSGAGGRFGPAGQIAVFARYGSGAGGQALACRRSGLVALWWGKLSSGSASSVSAWTLGLAGDRLTMVTHRDYASTTRRFVAVNRGCWSPATR